MSQRLKCWKCGRTYANILTLMNQTIDPCLLQNSSVLVTEFFAVREYPSLSPLPQT